MGGWGRMVPNFYKTLFFVAYSTIIFKVPYLCYYMGWMGGWVHKFGTFSQIKLFFIRLSKRQRKWKIKEIQKNLASLVLPPHVMRRSPRTSDGEILTFAFSICHLFYTYTPKCTNLWQNTVNLAQNSLFRVLFGFFTCSKYFTHSRTIIMIFMKISPATDLVLPSTITTWPDLTWPDLT